MPAEDVPATAPALGTLIHRAQTSQPRRSIGWWRSLAAARMGLILLAATQIALTFPILILGSDRDAPLHVAHEMGSFDLALAIGFVVAAWDPMRAQGMRTLVGAAAVLLLVTAVIDLVAGRTTAGDEAPHLITLAGWLLLVRTGRLSLVDRGGTGLWRWATKGAVRRTGASPVAALPDEDERWSPAASPARRAAPMACLALVAALGAGLWGASLARADGDPGSDVLVYQNLFVGADAGTSIAQQVQLGNLLASTSRAGVPIRVAIIAHRDDLGAVTALWDKPRAYARFLGIELSLAYKQRLLVVMPDGFGFNWPGHPTAGTYRLLSAVPVGSGPNSLVRATRQAVSRMVTGAGARLERNSGSPTTSPASSPGVPQSPAGAGSNPGRVTVVAQSRGAHSPGAGDQTVGLITMGIIGALVLVYAARRLMWTQLRNRLARDALDPDQRVSRLGAMTWRIGTGTAVLCAGAAAVAVLTLSGNAGPPAIAALDSNPVLDPGTALAGRAPNFTLINQFGRRVSLRSFRGKVVLLAFTDSECTTICPLTTSAMVQAQSMLGAAGSRVELLGVDANPKDTSLQDVLSYTQLHGLLGRWQFLTGSLPALRRVWRDYGVEAQINAGLISHTPALLVIGPNGERARLYLTQQSYAAVGQLGQLLAAEISRLLPGHPRVKSSMSYAHIAGIGPNTRASLPSSGGHAVPVGPGTARVLLFFATWDQEVTSLAGHMSALNAYQHAATRLRLPKLTAVDEAPVEPSPRALPQFLNALPARLNYPVGLDTSGRVADGYGVSALPTLEVSSAGGRVLWYWNVSVLGWPSTQALEAHVRAALKYGARLASSGARQLTRELAGSPKPLAALHSQASQLLGSEPALEARLRSLRGYPVVLNVWASWCTPCREEFGLLAQASAVYGRKVAFLGSDTDDSASDAKGFLASHRVSYPSYQSSSSQLQQIVPQGIAGLPTTIFIDARGRVDFVHTGQYDSLGTLEADITNHALNGKQP